MMFAFSTSYTASAHEFTRFPAREVSYRRGDDVAQVCFLVRAPEITLVGVWLADQATNQALGQLPRCQKKSLK